MGSGNAVVSGEAEGATAEEKRGQEESSVGTRQLTVRSRSAETPRGLELGGSSRECNLCYYSSAEGHSKAADSARAE